MRFYTASKCEEWLTGRMRIKPDLAHAKPSLRLKYPSSPHRIYGWARSLAANYVNVFFSHEEFIDFYSDDESLIDQLRDALIDSKPA